MRPLKRSSSIDQSAAFALFEAFRQAQGLSAAPDGTGRVTFLRAVDPAVAGLAWTSTDDDALQLRWGDAPAAVGEHLWVHAASGDRGPVLALYTRRDKPGLQVHFSGSSFQEQADGRYVLRERATYPSHDGRHKEREALTRELAMAWRVPMDGPWLTIGTWDSLENRWDAEAARRMLAVMLILEAARHLDEDWLTV